MKFYILSIRMVQHSILPELLTQKVMFLELTPHPEAYIFPENHPRWTEGIKEKQTGLKIFQNGINYFN